MTKYMRFIGVFLMVMFLIAIIPMQGNEGGDENKAPTPLEILAAYAHDAQFEEFPPEVVKRAKFLILDNVGCALGGTQIDVGRKFLRVGAHWQGNPESTVIGTGDKISCMSAAYVNTQVANALDFDDTYDLYPPGHPGNSLVQSAIAVGEAEGASGKELLTAVILGYEVGLRIGRGEGGFDWQNSSYFGSVTRGVIAVAGRLRKLNLDELKGAFYHALEYRIPHKHDKFDIPTNLIIPEIKSNFGFYVMEGLLATRLAQQGITAYPSALDNDLKGWYLGGGEVKEYDQLTKGLGKVYRLMEVSFKPTPSCRLTHAPIGTLWEALDRKPVKAKDIEQIVVKWPKRLDRPDWEVEMEAQFSVQCAMALAAAGVEPGPQWWTNNKFNDPEIKELAAKIKLENDPEAEELEIRESKPKCTVIVTFKNGQVKKATTHGILGDPDRPLSEEELIEKFKANSRGIFNETQINGILDKLLNLEKLPKVSDLTKMLVSLNVTMELENKEK